MKATLTFATLLLSCALAAAGIGQGTITQVEAGPVYGSKVFVIVTGGVSDHPACTTPGNYNFVFDTSVAGGKELLSMLLLAKSTQQAVIISGAGTCTLYGGVEDLRWLRLP